MMSKESDEEGKSKKTYNPEVDDYSSMAHYVAKVLGIRPSIILDEWTVPELIVAFGIYRNEQQEEIYQNVKAQNKHLKGKDKLPKVDRYIVKFYSREDAESAFS